MRPYLLFVSGITGIAGISFSSKLSLAGTILLSLAFFLSYGFGQALTDCFQTDTDSLSSPYRPLVQGKISKMNVMIISLTGLLFCGIVFFIYNNINFILSVLSVLGLITYTYFKRRWWGGPFYNSWIVAVLCIMGFLSGNYATSITGLLLPSFIFTLITVFFGYANFVLTGYYKDISADRATGYNTLPVVYGLKLSSVISDVFAALEVIGCYAALYFTSFKNGVQFLQIFPLIFVAYGSYLTLLAQVRLHSIKNESEAHRAISPVVHSYILLLSSIALANRPLWLLPIVLFYFGFNLTMRYRPLKAQI
jgi:4-hydroxybenzoate polyprenyltransferase